MPTSYVKPFDISAFRADVNNTGVMKNNSFMVEMTPPKCILSGIPPQDMTTTGAITMRCSGAVIPGQNINTRPVNRFGYGLPEQFAVSVVNTDIALEFILDREYIMRYFETWLLNINNYQKYRDIDYIQPVNAEVRDTSLPAYFTNYKENYVSNMRITVFDATGVISKVVELTEVFPKGISAVNLNWNNTDQLPKLGVTFTYRDIIHQRILPTGRTAGLGEN